MVGVLDGVRDFLLLFVGRDWLGNQVFPFLRVKDHVPNGVIWRLS